MAETADFPAEGGCACGEVRYEMKSAPMFVHCCHCRWCQRETGAAFALNALIEARQVEVTSGKIKKVTIPSESGKEHIYAHCPKCQVALWSHYGGMGEKVSFIRVGTLDNPDIAPPDIHIYTSSKQPWVSLSHDTPAVRNYYKRSEYWPEESIQRMAALRE